MANECQDHEEHEAIKAMIRHNRWVIGWIAFLVTLHLIWSVYAHLKGI